MSDFEQFHKGVGRWESSLLGGFPPADSRVYHN